MSYSWASCLIGLTEKAEYNSWVFTTKPRVLLFGSAVGGGGAERRFRLLLEHMFDGTVDGIALRNGVPPNLKPSQRFDTLGWQSKGDYARAIFRLRRIIDSGRYDAIVSLGLYPNVILWAASRFLRNRPALVMTEITRPFTESKHFAGPLTGRLRQILYRLSYNGADLVAANSEDGKYEIISHYHVPPSTVVRVPNLIEAGVVRKLADTSGGVEELVPRPGVFRICLVARLDPIKRIDTLLRAAHALGSDFDWEIDLVGDGPNRGLIESLSEELSIRAKVRLHGWLENPYPIIRAADVTVLCSEYEGFSNSVLESMVIGTPVVTSYCSRDAREMVSAAAALGFEIGDWRELADLLKILRDSPGIAARLRASGLLYSEAHHVSNAIPVYERLVREAIARIS